MPFSIFFSYFLGFVFKFPYASAILSSYLRVDLTRLVCMYVCAGGAVGEIGGSRKSAFRSPLLSRFYEMITR